jgi:hypothetical protein
LNLVKDGFKDWTDQEHPECYLVDGSAFLSKVPYEDYQESSAEDEFPF